MQPFRLNARAIPTRWMQATANSRAACRTVRSLKEISMGHQVVELGFDSSTMQQTTE